MVHATLGGRPTLLIVDTGASDTVLTRQLVSSWGGELVEVEPGTDHAGAPVRSWQLVGEVPISIGGWSSSLASPIVIDGPAPFEGWGIGGFVSPQTLHKTATLVIDLRELRLQLLTGGLEAVRAGFEERLGSPATLSLPRRLGEGDAARLIVVDASAGDGESIPMMINTGGSSAELSPSVLHSEPAGTAPQVVGRGLSGAEVVGTSQHHVQLQLGHQTLSLDDVTLREQGESYKGQLGITELRGNILLIQPFPDGALVWWR